MFKIYNGGEYFFQWDLNQKIIVDDSFCKVHYCNKTDDCALVVEVYEVDGVKLANVPNILLQSTNNIRVYGINKDGAETINTKHYAEFRVIARGKPENYVYEETEVLNYEALEARVTALESTPAVPEGVMIYKGDTGWIEPANPQKGEVYYCKNTITSSEQFDNLNFGSCDYIGDNHVAMTLNDNTNAFFTNAIGNNCTIYRYDDSGNIIASLSPTVTSVEDGCHIYFSGTTQAELETIFSYGSATGYGIIDGFVTEPFVEGRLVFYDGAEWQILRGELQ